MATSDSLRAAARPLTAYFNKRFTDLFQHVSNEAWETRQEVKQVTHLVREVADSVDPAMQTVAEASTLLQHAGLRLEHQLESMREAIEGDMLLKVLADQPATMDRIARRLMGTPVEELSRNMAELVNWAQGHLGFAAQAGLWLNQGVYVELLPGGGHVRSVNERLIEVPYAMGVASGLSRGAHVLDVGSVESTFALSLASLGYDTIALDFRPYPFTHRKLEVVTAKVEEWDGPARPLDAVFSISTIEHLGVGAYGEDPSAATLDRLAVERFKRWLRPGGVFVLTAPYGVWGVDELERTYDAEHLDRLLEGWEVTDRRFGRRTSETSWEVLDEEPDPSSWPAGGGGVVLLTARPG